jgi:hypothetical protein
MFGGILTLSVSLHPMLIVDFEIPPSIFTKLISDENLNKYPINILFEKMERKI